MNRRHILLGVGTAAAAAGTWWAVGRRGSRPEATVPEDREPHQIIADLVAAHEGTPDEGVLAELASLPPFPDERDPAWDREATWLEAYRFVALADVAAARRLRPAIRPLLDRACYGDPGELFRGLRHALEAIENPDWAALADVCLEAARSPRPGTRMWAVHQLAVLEDERARPVFEESVRRDLDPIRWLAEGGLRGLDRQRHRAKPGGAPDGG